MTLFLISYIKAAPEFSECVSMLEIQLTGSYSVICYGILHLGHTLSLIQLIPLFPKERSLPGIITPSDIGDTAHAMKQFSLFEK